MGELNLHDLTKYVDNGCKTFVETGTGKGNGLKHAMKYNFEQLYSIEIMRVLWKECMETFKNEQRIHLLHNNSIKGIKEVFDYMENKTAPVFWWLDAHFPGADFQLGNYDDDHPKHIKNPLEAELQTITSERDFSKDVFILDDLGLYEPGKYQYSQRNLDLYRNKLGLNNKFVYEIFEQTHTIRKDFRHQGFLILEPK